VLTCATLNCVARVWEERTSGPHGRRIRRTGRGDQARIALARDSSGGVLHVLREPRTREVMF
jgi:hypothetical protein